MNKNLGHTGTGSDPRQEINSGRRGFLQQLSALMITPDSAVVNTFDSLLQAPAALTTVITKEAAANFLKSSGLLEAKMLFFKQRFQTLAALEFLSDDFEGIGYPDTIEEELVSYFSKLREDEEFMKVFHRIKDEVPAMNPRIMNFLRAEASRLLNADDVAHNEDLNKAMRNCFFQLDSLPIPNDDLLTNSIEWRRFLADYTQVCKDFGFNNSYVHQVSCFVENLCAEVTLNLFGLPIQDEKPGTGLSELHAMTERCKIVYDVFTPSTLWSDSRQSFSLARLILDPDLVKRYISADKLMQLKPASSVDARNGSPEVQQVKLKDGEQGSKSAIKHASGKPSTEETLEYSFGESPVLKIKIPRASGNIASREAMDQLAEIFAAVKELRGLNLVINSESDIRTANVCLNAGNLSPSIKLVVVYLARVLDCKLVWRMVDGENKCDLDSESVAIIMLDKVKSFQLEFNEIDSPGSEEEPAARVRFFEASSALVAPPAPTSSLNSR